VVYTAQELMAKIAQATADIVMAAIIHCKAKLQQLATQKAWDLLLTYRRCPKSTIPSC
jgi:hypothetical protein